MIRYLVFAITCFFLLTACSIHYRILTRETNGLKTMRLTQTAEVYPIPGVQHKEPVLPLKIELHYWYREQPQARPITGVNINSLNPAVQPADSILNILLQGEDIRLYAHMGQYYIPENLWVSIIHSPSVAYKWKIHQQPVFLQLDKRQTDQLIDFFNRAIKHRDEMFPALREGQKKW